MLLMSPARLGLTALTLYVLVATASGDEFAAVEHARQTIYHSPQTPGFTSWVGAWTMPDGSLMVSFTQATGPVEGRPQAPKDVQQKLTWPPAGHPGYDMTGLDMRNVHLRSTDAGKSWQPVSSDAFKSCMNGVTNEALTALADGTILRGVFGFYLPYDPDLPQTGFLQRSSDGTKTWGKPEVPIDAAKYSTWPRRIRELRDGRVVLLAGVAQAPAGSQTRQEFSKVVEPALLVSSDQGRTWKGPVAAIVAEQRGGWTEEFDVAELANGDLLCVFRRENDAKRWQSTLKKSGDTWIAQPAGPSVLPHSGQPELLATREGPILHVATSGVSWTDDAGKSWHTLAVPGTAYYPRSIQAKDGTIYIFGHVGGDNAYGSVDQSIVMDTFRVKAEAPQGLTAATTSPVHPVLIRNEHGPLLRVIVDAADPKDVRVNAVSFKLDGTDDLGDLDSLTLFSTGDKEEFSAVTTFGEPVKPATTAAFSGEQALRTGKNVFWLSCRLKTTADLSHRVAATCTAVETTDGKLAPRDDSPGVRHRIGVALRKHNDDGVHTYRIPALATTPKGTLLCVYDMRRRMGRDLQEDIDTGLSRSTDGGQTWEPVRVIMDMGEYGGLPQEQNGCSDPGIIVDRQTGEIFCFAVWMNGKPGKHQWNDDGSEPGFEIGKSAQFMMVRSRDDGLTWSKPENLTRKLKQEAWWLLAPSPQQGINLPDGTLVMPVEGRDGQDALSTFATIMISRDHGTTWTVGKPAFSGGNECQAAELGDGSIMLNMRNDHERFRAVFVTKDLGQTWQPHETNRNTLIEPNCNGSLLRVDYEHAGAKKHALLFANPHTQQGRTHHTIQVSFDDGRTWPKSHHLLLDEGRGAGYPSLTRVDDQHVSIVYEGSQSHLVFEKFSLDELLGR